MSSCRTVLLSFFITHLSHLCFLNMCNRLQSQVLGLPSRGCSSHRLWWQDYCCSARLRRSRFDAVKVQWMLIMLLKCARLYFCKMSSTLEDINILSILLLWWFELSLCHPNSMFALQSTVFVFCSCVVFFLAEFFTAAELPASWVDSVAQLNLVLQSLAESWLENWCLGQTSFCIVRFVSFCSMLLNNVKYS